MANDAELSENDKAYINHYVGQAYFSRAYAYFELALHYCKNYDPASAGSDYGIPLVQNMRLVRIIPNIPVVAA